MIAITKRHLTLLAGTVLLLGSAVSASADYVFNFDTLSPSASNQSSAIATYIDGIIGCPNCVTVSSGVAVAQKYNGDGHVVGPGGSSLTLGNTNGATNNSGPVNGSYDSYISNTAAAADGSSPNQLSSQIIITFTSGFSLSGTFSFDYQIFPDGGCAQLTSAACGGAAVGGIFPNQPDLNFVANGSTPVNTTFYGMAPGTTNGTSTKSPASGAGTELSPQLIGTWSGTLTNATSLSFIDWPATIGVDNLKLVTIPEPTGGVFFLGALALAAIAGFRLRRAMAKSWRSDTRVGLGAA